MPGIVGIIKRRPYEGIDRDLRLMVESMRHEKFYVGNQYVNQDLGLHVGWLSHPGSLGESMPLISRDKRRVLIIVGEHFSHLHKAKSPNGNRFRDGGAHDLFRLYEESEDRFFSSLNGWFSGVAIDLNLGKVTLFNDRYGMSRVYLHEGADEFIFASEAKSLLRIRPSLRVIEPEALAQYLRFNCVMGNKTWFKGISLLPGASSWAFTGQVGPQKRAYFDFADWEEQPTVGSEEFHERFEETVSRVFPAYMEDAQQVALSLTAGLDTRALLADARQQGRSLPCYTFGGLWGETFDIRAARRLAGVCNLTHEVIRINERFLQEFASYAQKSVYISDGTHDALGAHDVYFNQLARGIAPIRLTGKFGSEVVRTRRLIPSGTFPLHLVQPWVVPFLNEAPSIDQISKRAHPLSRVVAEEIAWYEFGRVSVEQSQVILRTPYMDNELVKLMYQAAPALRSSRDLQARYVRQKDQEVSDVPTNMGRVRENGQPMDRVAYGLYWALFKAEFIYLYSTPHWLTRLDRKLEKLRPERIIAGRQKFEGYRVWFKTHLADFVRETLLNPQAHCTDFFDKAWLTKVVEGHTAGTHNYLLEINKMLTVELICSSLLGPSMPLDTDSSVASISCVTTERADGNITPQPTAHSQEGAAERFA
jgi:asparagine synthase (glutamine-hydrolysing)